MPPVPAPRGTVAQRTRRRIPGTPLPNNRWELMAHGLAKGKTQGTAYKEAGFTQNSKSAKKLAVHPVICARVDELIASAVQQTTLSIGKVLCELEKIGFANMLDYIKIDGEGNPDLNFTDLDREKAAAIGEIITDVITNPRDGSITKRTKFKLLDKKGALVDMGRHLGMFKEVKDVNHRGVILHLNADDMAL